jgi:hypothetical protein
MDDTIPRSNTNAIGAALRRFVRDRSNGNITDINSALSAFRAGERPYLPYTDSDPTYGPSRIYCLAETLCFIVFSQKVGAFRHNQVLTDELQVRIGDACIEPPV